jgi:hypothetical protein
MCVIALKKRKFFTYAPAIFRAVVALAYMRNDNIEMEVEERDCATVVWADI